MNKDEIQMHMNTFQYIAIVIMLGTIMFMVLMCNWRIVTVEKKIDKLLENQNYVVLEEKE